MKKMAIKTCLRTTAIFALVVGMPRMTASAARPAEIILASAARKSAQKTMSKSDKWSLCMVCNRRAAYKTNLCPRQRCRLINKYLGTPKSLMEMMDILTPKVLKFIAVKCQECSDTGIIEHLGGFDYDRKCPNGCPIKDRRDW